MKVVWLINIQIFQFISAALASPWIEGLSCNNYVGVIKLDTVESPLNVEDKGDTSHQTCPENATGFSSTIKI